MHAVNISLCPSVTLPNSTGQQPEAIVKCDHLASSTITSTNSSSAELPVTARSSALCPSCLIIATHSHTIYIARLLLPDLLELHFAQSTVCVVARKGFVCLQTATASTFTFAFSLSLLLLHLCLCCLPAHLPPHRQYYEKNEAYVIDSEFHTLSQSQSSESPKIEEDNTRAR